MRIICASIDVRTLLACCIYSICCFFYMTTIATTHEEKDLQEKDLLVLSGTGRSQDQQEDTRCRRCCNLYCCERERDGVTYTGCPALVRWSDSERGKKVLQCLGTSCLIGGVVTYLLVVCLCAGKAINC